MHPAAQRCAAGAVGLLLAMGTAGCAGVAPAATATSSHAEGTGRGSATSDEASGAADGAAEATRLAPPGPAPGGPGGPGDDDEARQVPAAAALAESIGCEDLEPQAHVSAVAEQLSCRRGVDHVYVMTFYSETDRDTYLSGTPVVPGGFNVVGPTWVVHVEAVAIADAVATRLGGSVRPGA